MVVESHALEERAGFPAFQLERADADVLRAPERKSDECFYVTLAQWRIDQVTREGREAGGAWDATVSTIEIPRIGIDLPPANQDRAVIGREHLLDDADRSRRRLAD